MFVSTVHLRYLQVGLYGKQLIAMTALCCHSVVSENSYDVRDDSKTFLVLKPAGLRTDKLPIEYERLPIYRHPLAPPGSASA